MKNSENWAKHIVKIAGEKTELELKVRAMMVNLRMTWGTKSAKEKEDIRKELGDLLTRTSTAEVSLKDSYRCFDNAVEKEISN